MMAFAVLVHIAATMATAASLLMATMMRALIAVPRTAVTAAASCNENHIEEIVVGKIIQLYIFSILSLKYMDMCLDFANFYFHIFVN
jgi:hypothetical protein